MMLIILILLSELAGITIHLASLNAWHRKQDLLTINLQFKSCHYCGTCSEITFPPHTETPTTAAAVLRSCPPILQPTTERLLPLGKGMITSSESQISPHHPTFTRILGLQKLFDNRRLTAGVSSSPSPRKKRIRASSQKQQPMVSVIGDIDHGPSLSSSTSPPTSPLSQQQLPFTIPKPLISRPNRFQDDIGLVVTLGE